MYVADGSPVRWRQAPRVPDAVTFDRVFSQRQEPDWSALILSDAVDTEPAGHTQTQSHGPLGAGL
jgi:hypothetical protein